MSIFLQPEDSDSYEYITDGALMQCTAGALPCPRKAKDKGVMLGDKTSCSTIDNDPIQNKFDFGICKITKQPCVNNIKLGNWENYKKDLYFDEHPALTNRSTIKCTMGGTIKFNTTGQIGEVPVVSGVKTYGDKAKTEAEIQYTKLAFHTDYDICSDEVTDFVDYKNFYVLTDNNECYHWLFLRENPDDYSTVKPESIPFTWESNKPLILTATFQVISDKAIEKVPLLRLQQQGEGEEKYLFKERKAKRAKGKGKCDEFTVTFISKNTPFKNSVQYIENFVLTVECSWDDGKTWHKVGSSQNTLYITWRKPLWDRFKKELLETEQTATQVKNTNNNAKPCILETLLYLGCKQAHSIQLGKESSSEFEEAVAIEIFKAFEGLEVKRAREDTPYRTPLTNGCMGYWRGISVADSGNPTTNNTDPRSKMFYDKHKNLYIPRCLRSLLKYGEARCGEWTFFFLHLLLAQGIEVDLNNDICAICTDFAIVEGGFSYKYRILPHNYKNKSIIFGVKDAILQNDGTPIGLSPAQGNKNAQSTFMDHIWVYFRDKIFFDPSYGKSYTNINMCTLQHYCKNNLTSVLVENRAYNEKTDFNNFKGFIVYDDIEKSIICSKEKPTKK